MSRTPKLGEVWTDLTNSMTCTDEVPDDRGNYGWSWVRGGHTIKAYLTLDDMAPPKAGPPEWLKAAPWFPVSRRLVLSTGKTTAAEVHKAGFGAINVLTGEWVPRD